MKLLKEFAWPLNLVVAAWKYSWNLQTEKAQVGQDWANIMCHAETSAPSHPILKSQLPLH